MKSPNAARALLVVVFHATIGFAQSFDGLEPGRSTRSEVERAYGAPLKELSATLVEYRSAREAEQIFVQYRKSSTVVERVEKISARPAERSSVLAGLSLPLAPTVSRVNAKGRLEEFFASGQTVLTFVAGDAASGVSRVARYSPELFEAATAGLPRTATNGWEPREQEMSYTGTNLTYFPEPSLDRCQSSCTANDNCRAFTWIAPGTYNPDDSAMCYLSAVVTGRSPAKGHTSAVKSVP